MAQSSPLKTISLYLQRLTKIGAKINSHVHHILWDVITHLCPKFGLTKPMLKWGHGRIPSHCYMPMYLFIHALILIPLSLFPAYKRIPRSLATMGLIKQDKRVLGVVSLTHLSFMTRMWNWNCVHAPKAKVQLEILIRNTIFVIQNFIIYELWPYTWTIHNFRVF